MQVCDYGCGLEAKYQLKNGKWCCSEIYQSCPGVRKKNSESHKGKTQSEETKQKNSESNKGKIPWNKGIKTGPPSEEIKKKRSDANKLTIEKINKKYPSFSKVEKMKYNPEKPDEKEIQVHCKNHNCKNSKEKGGWFTPNYYAFKNRTWAIEKPDGNDGLYFYCCQECKDTCPLYGVKSDPLKESKLPYTSSEYQLWRKTVLNLDKGLCQGCEKTATDVHHILPVKTHPHLALDPDNGISFCKECHYKIGHKIRTECSTGNLAKITCSPESQKFLNQK